MFDQMMMKQYSMMLNMYTEESDKISNLKTEFRKLGEIKELEDARSYVYEKYPKFKDNTSFSVMGVKYMIHDTEENLRVLAWFTDEIICYDYV